MSSGSPLRQTLAAIGRFYRRPIRLIGTLTLFVIPSACAWCVPNLVPPQAEEQNAFCVQYVSEGKLAEAEARGKLAIEYASKYAEPYNCLGLVAYHRGQLDRAVEYFKQAISHKNDFAEAHNNLGAIFMNERREYAAAEDQFREAIEVDPGYVPARANLGLCLLYKGEDEDARDQYLRCVELDPDACDCRMGMGVLAMNAKEWEDARSHFEKLTQICPQDPNGFYNLGYTSLMVMKCTEAVDSLVSALALKPDYIEARKNLIQAYDCLGKQDGTVMQYMEKIRQNPGDPEPHFNLGALYEDRKDFARALNEFLNTIKLHEAYEIAYYRAARLFDRNLQTQDTINYCQRFVDLLRGEKYPKEKGWCVSRVKELQFGGVVTP